MRQIAAVSLFALLSGCALTPERVAERAKLKTNAELCAAAIQFPQYGDAINAELVTRGHTCDWALTAAQVEAASARRVALQAALTADTQPTYKIVKPAPVAPVSLQMPLQPTSVTAYWTGQQRQVQTVTYQSGWNCEYNYAGRTFWRTFTTNCPAAIQVQ